MNADPDNEHRNRGAIVSWLTILGQVVGVYLLINLVLPDHLTSFASAYVVQPLLWCGSILTVLLASISGLWGKLKFTRSMLGIGLLLGAFQVAVLLIIGLFIVSGLGGSPYAHSLRYLFLNAVFFGTALVGMEFSRAYLLGAFNKRYATLMLVFSALLYTALMIPLDRFTHLSDPFPFVGGTCLPLVAQNLLASFLALLGGPVASIAYWGVMKAFEWYSPLLPDLSWIVNAFGGTLAAVIGLLVVQMIYGAEVEPVKARVEVKAEVKKKRSSLVGWVAVAIICVAAIFITFGALGFRPNIVGSGSMRPALDVGDIVVVKAVSADAINKGDVIEFKDGSTNTIHRVVDIQEQSGSRVFITQGDANNIPDHQPVLPQQLLGKVWFRIPKVGWVSIGIKNLFR